MQSQTGHRTGDLAKYIENQYLT